MGDFISIFIFIFGLFLVLFQVYALGALLMGVGTGMIAFELFLDWLSRHV